jgi:DNA-binding response OmpR family regulator
LTCAGESSNFSAEPKEKGKIVPLNILLADDSMTAQNMAKKILSEAGYEVTTVSNGAAALKKIAERTPDLAILDIYMPGYTGLEVCERVKRAATTSNMPVLLSVGKLEPYREQDATEARADGVIVKPFEATELVTIVTNVILRASGGTIDAATRPPTPPVAMHTSPVVEPEALPAMDFEGYAAEPASLESRVPDAGSAFTYGPDTISNGDYLGTSLPPPVEQVVREGSHFGFAVPEKEKPMAMAVPAPVAATGPDNFAGSHATDANSSMPFMMDELLKADEKAPAEDSVHRFSGPELDVSPVEDISPTEDVAEDIEVIEIPSPEPESRAGTQVSQEAAVHAEATANDTGVPAEELTAMDVEAFMREHAAGSASANGSDAEVQEVAGAITAGPHGSDTGSNELAQAPQASAAEAQAAPGIAEGDNRPVFEPEDMHSVTPSFTSTSATETTPTVDESVGRFDFKKEFGAAIATAGAAAPAFDAALVEPPAAVAAVSPAQEREPEAVPASPSPATENEVEAANAGDDFMFSVPMMLEGTAAMSLPGLPDPAPRAGSESAGASMFGAPDYAAEARPAALDEAAIAGVVQRVMDRFKPQIVAEIVRELAKHKQ